jgi:hypothetical protein
LAAVASSSADAELIALGREYDALSIEMDRLAPEFGQAEQRWKEATDAWWAENPPSQCAGLSEEEKAQVREERNAFVAAALTAIGKATGFDPHPMHKLHNRRDELAVRIGKARATTIQGLAVQARQVAEDSLRPSDWEEPIGNLDWDKVGIRVLVENLCAAAGVDLRGRSVAKEA